MRPSKIGLDTFQRHVCLGFPSKGVWEPVGIWHLWLIWHWVWWVRVACGVQPRDGVKPNMFSKATISRRSPSVPRRVLLWSMGLNWLPPLGLKPWKGRALLLDKAMWWPLWVWKSSRALPGHLIAVPQIKLLSQCASHLSATLYSFSRCSKYPTPQRTSFGGEKIKIAASFGNLSFRNCPWVAKNCEDVLRNRWIWNYATLNHFRKSSILQPRSRCLHFAMLSPSSWNCAWHYRICSRHHHHRNE